MQDAYESFRADGRLPATFEVVFGQAWSPGAASPAHGSLPTHVSLDDIKRQLRTRRG